MTCHALVPATSYSLYRSISIFFALRLEYFQEYVNRVVEKEVRYPPLYPGDKGRVAPFTTGNPFLRTKLLDFSRGRGLGALKGLMWAAMVMPWLFFTLSREKKKKNGVRFVVYQR